MNAPKTLIVLFNYGGGMRGLVPAHLMSRIEEVTGLRMAEMVDVFCGPSTGSILNAALNVPKPDEPMTPKFRARHMVRFYEREGANIFPPDRFRDFRGFIHDFNNRTMKIGQLNSLFRHGHYDPANLGRSLKMLFGECRLSESIRNLVVPVYNIDGDHLRAMMEKGESDYSPVHQKNNLIDEGGHAVWLKKMKLGRNERPTPDVKLYDAVLASCAAPTYFPCHHFSARYPDTRRTAEYSAIDGSIFDNPCISYLGAIQQHIPPGTNVIMIVLGTGYTLKSIKRESWNSYGGLGVVDPVNDFPLINILMHASESALMESFSLDMGDNLYVFNKSLHSPELGSNIPNPQIDDASPENMKKLEVFANALIEDNKHNFDQICHHLVRNRDARADDQSRVLKKMQQMMYFFKGQPEVTEN